MDGEKSIAKQAIKSTIPIMAGYLVLGTAFGILLADSGYKWYWALLMSTSIYAGSMQFVAVDLLSHGATMISTAIMTLLVNARHLVYGISMIEKYRGTGKVKPYLMFALTDETYALLCSDKTNSKKYYFLVSLFDHIYWIVGSVAGTLIGSALTINTKGIDFAMTALFVVIFTDQWMSTKNHFAAILGVCVTTVCLIIFGTKNFLIPSMIIIVLTLTVSELIKSKKEREKEDEQVNA